MQSNSHITKATSYRAVAQIEKDINASIGSSGVNLEKLFFITPPQAHE